MQYDDDEHRRLPRWRTCCPARRCGPAPAISSGCPGSATLQEGKTQGALADRVVAYDVDWTIALHAPYLDYLGSRSKDLFRQHTLQPGESRQFDAWLQVGVARRSRPRAGRRNRAQASRLPGIVHGVVRSRDGKTVDEPVIVIEQHGMPYAWSFGRAGRYEVRLPAGDYELVCDCQGSFAERARPRARCARTRMTALIFADSSRPAGSNSTVVDARTQRCTRRPHRASPQGQQQLVEFLGRNTFFTELDRKGRLRAELAPGTYRFAVSSGGGFLGPSAGCEARRAAQARRRSRKVAIDAACSIRPASGWYSADLHHHADQAEGVTPPEYLARSQLAAGLDLLFVSDHDSTANHAPLQQIADRRGMPFIPSLELSPSWGHFNAWPLQPGQTARDRHEHRDHRRSPRRSATPGRDRRAIEPSVHSVWISREPRGRRRARRLQSRIRPRSKSTRTCRLRREGAAARSGTSGMPGIATTCPAGRTCTTSGTTSRDASARSRTSTASPPHAVLPKL